MCGIVGLSTSRANKTTIERLARAVQSMRHRGPDAQADFCSPPFFLGHTRLAIQDLSVAGNQPMISRNKKYVMVYNGEIYNAQEIRDQLLQKGVSFRGHSDSEVILEGFAVFGESIFQRLNGIFALAIADLESKQLILVRDPMGVKPLYYVKSSKGFAFASEIKALMQVMDFDRTLDPISAMRYATLLWSPGTGTMFRNVKKLEAGHILVVENSEIKRLYKFATLPEYAPNNSWTQEECKVELTKQLDQAVERQMISDTPVGSFLSGGVDSTAIVAFARKYAPALPCFTMKVVGANNSEIEDDLPYARLAAKALGVKLHEVQIGSIDLINNLEKMVETLEEPNADPASMNLRFISEMARAHGIKVLLSGTGGDDVFSGYRRHSALRVDQLIAKLPFVLRSGLSGLGSGRLFGGVGTRKIEKLLRNIDGSDADRLVGLFSWISPNTSSNLFSKDFLALASEPISSWDLPLRDEVLKNATYPNLEKCLRLEQKFFLTDHNLFYTDKMGMAEGVEIRVPFVDLELMKFAATIPSDWKMRGMSPKWMLRKSLEGVIPNAILRRRKAGFGVPLRDWIRGPMRDYVANLLSDTSIKSRGLFNPIAVAKLLDDQDRGTVDASYTILSLVCIELWARRFSDSKAA